MTASSDFILQTDALSSFIGPALVQKSQFLGSTIIERFEDNGKGVKTVKFRKGGYLTAATVTEGSNYTFPSTNTQASVSATAEKKVSGDKLTVEAKKWASDFANQEMTAKKCAAALARLFDSDLKALFTGLSQSVTGTTLTAAKILDAIYNINLGTATNLSGDLVSAISVKQAKELGTDLLSASGQVFGNAALVDLIGLDYSIPVGQRGYKGKLYGVDMFETTGLPTVTTTTVGALWDRQLCFGAGLDVLPGEDGDTGVINGDISITQPQAGNGISWEFLMWTFFKVVEVMDEAGCRIISDT